jgi:hypothetical protein
MALLLNEIQWGEPLLPLVADPAWEAEVAKSRLASPDPVSTTVSSR